MFFSVTAWAKEPKDRCHPLHLEEKHDGMVTTCHLTKANEVQFVNFFGVSTHFLEEIPANHGNE